MPTKLADRIQETTATTGAADLVLGGSVSGFRTFGTFLTDGDDTYYSVVSEDQQVWEVGIGRYVAVGNTLQRTTVIASSNGNAKVTLPAGTKRVTCTNPAFREEAIEVDISGNVTIKGALQALGGVAGVGAGNDGDGWTGASYDPQTGIVTFTSDDGLGFQTGDLRGADGDDGADGADGATFDYGSSLPSPAGYSEGDLFLLIV